MNPGDHIGRYLIERVLGQGAVGLVCLASDPLIGRKVALKTLRADLEHAHAEEFKTRFLREASAAGRLSHPNITTVYDVGSDPATGVAFIAMEFVQGSTLEACLESQPRLEPERAVELGATLAEALGYAHSEGVVHRDIKPANILMTSTGSPKITDFGIARLDTSTLTVQGSVLGTPYYMSPEQVGGQTVDGRTDLYALGVILFEMLSGKRPYSGNSLVTMMTAILSQPPPDLSNLCPNVPSDLAEVIRRAISKAPEARFQSGSELAAALRAADLRGQPAAMESADATVMGVALDALGEYRGVLHFMAGDRRVHLSSKTELVIGRDPAADIQLSDQKVSRRHAVVQLRDGVVHLNDLASSNGSTRNGVRITAPVELADGDVVGIGGAVHLLVRYRRQHRPPVSAALIAGAEEYLLCPGDVAVGRDPFSVDVRVADPHVGPVHAWISVGIGVPVIRTQGDGTMVVDGVSTGRAPLTDRTTVQLGATQLLWLDADSTAATPGPTSF